MTALLNTHSLDELKSILEDELFGITSLFAEQLPGEIESLQAAVASGDTTAINRRGHSLKGSCANMGAEALSQQAMRIEKAALAGDMGVIQDALAQLPTLAQDTLRAMREGGYLQ